MADEPKTDSKSESKEGLAGLLSGKDGWMKIGVILVVLSGGGNILATKQSADLNTTEINKAISEIHDIHDQLQASIERQKEMLEALKGSKP